MLCVESFFLIRICSYLRLGLGPVGLPGCIMASVDGQALFKS